MRCRHQLGFGDEHLADVDVVRFAAAFSGSLFGVMLTAGSLGGAIGPLLFGVAAERFGLGAAFPLIAIISAGGAVAFLGMYRI